VRAAFLAHSIAKKALEDATAAASAAEDFAKNIERIVRAAVTAHATALGEGLVAEAVVRGALVGAAEHLVGLAQLLELVLRRFIAGILVRMVLHRQLAVGLLDLLRGGAAFDAQDVVIIAFGRRHLILLSLLVFRRFGDKNRGGPQQAVLELVTLA